MSSSVVVFEGGASPPSTPFLMPTHRGKRWAKKIRRQRHKRLTYLSPRDILYMLKGDKIFHLTFEDYFTTFRSSEVYGSCIFRICGFCEFSRQCSPIIISPCPLQHHLSKRQHHRRLTSAAFGDIIKLQNRRGGSLPKGR